jgi:putative transposase
MGEVYHTLNRGVDGRHLFVDRADRERFLLALNAFNTTDAVALCEMDGFVETDSRKKLVSIIAYTLLDNHFHICLREERQGGLTTFLRKLGTGYTHYFNKRHDRIGRLFQRKTQYKLVHNDTYLQHLIAYIHLNVMDTVSSEWRKGQLGSGDVVKKVLVAYQWSSARAFLTGTPNPIIDHVVVNEILPPGCLRNHLQYINSWSARNFPEVGLRED